MNLKVERHKNTITEVNLYTNRDVHENCDVCTFYAIATLHAGINEQMITGVKSPNSPFPK